MTSAGQHPAVPLEILVALSGLRLGTDTSAARLFQECRQPGGPLDVSDWRLLERLVGLLGMDPGKQAECAANARRRAGRALTDSQALGLTVLSCLDREYPARLAHIPDPPIVMWIAGRTEVLSGPSVAVVGSRYATPTGLGVARRLSRELVEAGLVVVSGLARGIDGAAHRGALEAGGPTIAVLGNGSDVAYPREHRELMAAVSGAGAVVTEFPPGTRPHPSHFPLRNRIISGLSQAVVVVEASERSGSLITARAALEQGRDVLAVPGSVTSGAYRGCHALIKDGARLVETVTDVLEELGRTLPGPVRSSQSQKLSNGSSLEKYMPPGDPVSVDELAVRSGRAAAEWLADLAILEVAGTVTRTAGGTFVRLDGPATYIEGQATGNGKGTGSVHGQGSGDRRVAGKGEDD